MTLYLYMGTFRCELSEEIHDTAAADTVSSHVDISRQVPGLVPRSQSWLLTGALQAGDLAQVQILQVLQGSHHQRKTCQWWADELEVFEGRWEIEVVYGRQICVVQEYGLEVGQIGEGITGDVVDGVRTDVYHFKTVGDVWVGLRELEMRKGGYCVVASGKTLQGGGENDMWDIIKVVWVYKEFSQDWKVGERFGVYVVDVVISDYK